MSAVSSPTPTTRASRRTIACGRDPGSSSSRCRRAASSSAICSRTSRSRAMSRRSSASVFGGSGAPSAVRSASRRSGAPRRPGLKLRTPRRARAPFIRFTIRVRSPPRPSRSRLGRLASSCPSVGIAAMLQWHGSPRSQRRKARLSSSVSRRSVLARRCSRETATLVGWMTWASTPRACSQRASQNPSRPASKATARRVIVRPALAASSRQRRSRASSASSLGASFLSGLRPIPGTSPATSQLDRLSSTTATSVLSCWKATRDRLRSLHCGMGHSIGCSRRRWSLTRAGRPLASEPGRERVGVPAAEQARPSRLAGLRGDRRDLLRGLELAGGGARPPGLDHPPRVGQSGQQLGPLVLRMWLPRALGGLELDFASGLRVMEELARVDASAAWVAFVVCGSAFAAARMSDEAAARVHARPQDLLCGSLNPPGRASPVEGGYQLTGRWPFTSGRDHAAWLLLSATLSGEAPPSPAGRPAPILCLVPAAASIVHDTWHTGGLRATGSNDVEVIGAFVPEGMTFRIDSAEDRRSRYHQGALYRAPLCGGIGTPIAAVALGIARKAIDTVLDIAGCKTPVGRASPLRDQPTLQADVARAEAAVRSAGSWLHATADRISELCSRRAPLPTEL